MNTRILRFTLTLSFLGLAASCSTTGAVEIDATEPPQVFSGKKQTAVFAGGCFWGVEAVFEHLKGVINVKSGYSGGTRETADYDAVSNGDTKHAEAVEVVFDPELISYQQLLSVFFSVAHNPTELNRQGPDVGPQYRSAIFYSDEVQKKQIEEFIESLKNSKTFAKPIVTEITPLDTFYAAEDYHQDFVKKNPKHGYVVAHDLPKLAALKTKFPDLYFIQNRLR